MRHDEMTEKIFLLRDGELPAAERPEAEKHLASCADCRAALDDWKKAAASLFAPADVGSSERFIQAVMRRIEDAPADRWSGFWSFPRLMFAGSAAAFALVAFLVFPQFQGTGPAVEGAAAIDYVSDLMESPAEYAEAAGPDAGDEIEEYFL